MKIISGGQTGADRAGLDVAIALGLPYGGCLPRGRRTEDGTLPKKYEGMHESGTYGYLDRTRRNVRDSDGTILFYHGYMGPGTTQTLAECEHYGKPCLSLNMLENQYTSTVSKWIEDNNIQTLNIAGSRGSKDPKIYEATYNFLHEVLAGFVGKDSRNFPGPDTV